MKIFLLNFDFFLRNNRMTRNNVSKSFDAIFTLIFTIEFNSCVIISDKYLR